MDDIQDTTIIDDAELKHLIEEAETEHTKLIEHPCEDVFDIEPGTTELVSEPPRQTQLVDVHTYDDKDREIEENYQEIFDRAMDTFDDIQRDLEGLEGKYKARNHEVGAQFLNAALSAAKEKQKLKEHKDKLSTNPNIQTGQGGPVTNNTQVNIATSTSDLVRMIQEQNGGPVAQNLSDSEGLDDDSTTEDDGVRDTPSRKTIKRSKPD